MGVAVVMGVECRDVILFFFIQFLAKYALPGHLLEEDSAKFKYLKVKLQELKSQVCGLNGWMERTQMDRWMGRPHGRDGKMDGMGRWTGRDGQVDGTERTGGRDGQVDGTGRWMDRQMDGRSGKRPGGQAGGLLFLGVCGLGVVVGQ